MAYFLPLAAQVWQACVAGRPRIGGIMAGVGGRGLGPRNLCGSRSRALTTLISDRRHRHKSPGQNREPNAPPRQALDSSQLVRTRPAAGLGLDWTRRSVVILHQKREKLQMYSNRPSSFNKVTKFKLIQVEIHEIKLVISYFFQIFEKLLQTKIYETL